MPSSIRVEQLKDGSFAIAGDRLRRNSDLLKGGRQRVGPEYQRRTVFWNGEPYWLDEARAKRFKTKEEAEAALEQEQEDKIFQLWNEL